MRKINEPADKVFFTSDQHFGHENIINFANRPFKDFKEMDDCMICNWNKVVPPDGLTLVLGDIGFCSADRITEIYAQLNGRKILIRGNHDSNYSDKVLSSIFDEIYDLLYARVFDDAMSKYFYMALCHYPMLDWQSSFTGSWQLFGHLHTRDLVEFGTLRTKLFASQYDVGVDNNAFRPISFYEVKEIMSAQSQDQTFKTTNYY